MMDVMALDRPTVISPTSEARNASFEAAFPELYPRAYGLAYRMMGNRAAAEDVAAETMAKALMRWNRLDPDRVAGWVLRTAGNQSIDLMRKKGRTLEAGVIDLEDQTTLRLSLAEAVRKLPKRQREVIVLRFLSDLSVVDTAKALGISEGSVKTHVHRGLAKLRDDLGPQTLEAVGAGSD
jgi:RNA polymerase sigma factor (sigma-70 family)